MKTTARNMTQGEAIEIIETIDSWLEYDNTGATAEDVCRFFDHCHMSTTESALILKFARERKHSQYMKEHPEESDISELNLGIRLLHACERADLFSVQKLTEDARGGFPKLLDTYDVGPATLNALRCVLHESGIDIESPYVKEVEHERNEIEIVFE